MISLGQRQIGPGAPCFVIAEVGVNHDGLIDDALRLIDEAAAAGVDAVKFQSFRAERLVTAQAAKAAYQRETTGEAGSQLEMLRRLELSFADHEVLRDRCQERGVIFLSTPFDEQSAEELCQLGVPALKVSSGDLTSLPFLEHLVELGLPLILSTGMGDLSEVEAAVAAVRGRGLRELVLLHCVSSYPAAAEEVNLRAMETLAEVFDVPVGYSDHTLGIEVALAAVALGACVVEKHFTLDRTRPGPDHRASIEPDELAALVAGVRRVELALGHGRKERAPSEQDVAAVARRSLVAAVDVAAGTVLTGEMIALRRPGTGLLPSALSEVIGRRAAVELSAGALLRWEELE